MFDNNSMKKCEFLILITIWRIFTRFQALEQDECVSERVRATQGFVEGLNYTIQREAL